MLTILSKAIDVASAVYDVIVTALDFLRWRDDWNRRWSPVSFYLAVFSFLVLVGFAWFWGAEAWAAFRQAVG
jgi:hypothetical protein